jgi:hypothetical protein
MPSLRPSVAQADPELH